MCCMPILLVTLVALSVVGDGGDRQEPAGPGPSAAQELREPEVAPETHLLVSFPVADGTISM